MLKIGDNAPLDIKSKNPENQDVSLNEYIGERVILYFYPKDDTPGCTKEACSFRDEQKLLTDLGLKVIGVSADSVKSHLKFKNKYNLNFELWSDSDHKLAQSFGVCGEKKLFGKISMGIKRATFIIDQSGKIEKVWPNVSVDQHLDEILKYLKN